MLNICLVLNTSALTGLKLKTLTKLGSRARIFAKPAMPDAKVTWNDKSKRNQLEKN